MKELSIIIPVYNTPGSLLERCFASILELRDVSYEVLLIDDGSGAETAEFCKEFAKKHEEFLHFRKENGGVSSARNMGLSHAKGAYITFVDADDELLPDAFSPELFRTDADLVIFDTDVAEAGVCSTWKGLELPAGAVDRADVLRRYVSGHALNGPYAKLYKTALIQVNDLRFDEAYVTAEDWLFGCSFALQVQQVTYVPVSSYLYYRDGGNAYSRLNRYPDTMLANLVGTYEKKLQILEQEFSNAPDLTWLRSVAAAAVVENLFNSAADLYLLKKETPQRKEKILKTCRQAMQYLSFSGWKKAWLKALLLTRCWVGIYPVAHLRCMYLKRKK